MANLRTNIPENERRQIILEAIWALLAKTPFDSGGIKSFFETLRFVYLDTAAGYRSIPPIWDREYYYNAERTREEKIAYDNNFRILSNEWRRNNNNEDGEINRGNISGRPISYLRKNHPDIYQALLPWLEIQNKDED